MGADDACINECAQEGQAVHKGHITLDALVQVLHTYADIGSTNASATQRRCYKVTTVTANLFRSDQSSRKARHTAPSCNSSTAVLKAHAEPGDTKSSEEVVACMKTFSMKVLLDAPSRPPVASLVFFSTGLRCWKTLKGTGFASSRFLNSHSIILAPSHIIRAAITITHTETKSTTRWNRTPSHCPHATCRSRRLRPARTRRP